jgi:hypothetical protein
MFASTCFKTEGVICRKMFFYVQDGILYFTCKYNRLPEAEPSVSKRVEEIIKIKLLNRKLAFCWFMLYNCYYLFAKIVRLKICLWNLMP